MNTQPLGQKPASPLENLTGMERALYDSVLALSAAMEGGMLAAFLVAPSKEGCMIELIFPKKEGEDDAAPNKSHKMETATPIGVMAAGGVMIHQRIMLEHQNALLGR